MNPYDWLLRLYQHPGTGKTRQLVDSLAIPGPTTLVVAANRIDLGHVRDRLVGVLSLASGLHFEMLGGTILHVSFHHPKYNRRIYFMTTLDVENGESAGLLVAPLLTDYAMAELLTQAARDRRELDVLKAEKKEV